MVTQQLPEIGCGDLVGRTASSAKTTIPSDWSGSKPP